jgi:hypothetical protein
LTNTILKKILTQTSALSTKAASNKISSLNNLIPAKGKINKKTKSKIKKHVWNQSKLIQKMLMVLT